MVDMKDIKWVKYGNYQGCRYLGKNKYDPPKPWGPWTKILGVVARCEGNHDTVVSYDNTAVTWGFMQWTFTSGRLQRLIESFKSIPHYSFEKGLDNVTTLFASTCETGNYGAQIFSKHGFEIRGGRFVDVSKQISLDPVKDKKRINDICLGRSFYPDSLSQQKIKAKQVAMLFGDLGVDQSIAAAQVQFAKQELKMGLDYRRKPLGEIGTIRNLLPQSDRAWELPIAAVFFNLWQNSPQGAYRLYMNVWGDAKRRGISDYPGHLRDGAEASFFNLVWERVNTTKFANWGWKSKRFKENKKGMKPRVYRIKLGIKEFYSIDLPFIKG